MARTAAQPGKHVTRRTKVQLKPLADQVVVILGASSGIGRETALRCADRGARVVVAARSEPGLRSLVDEIVASGGEAIAVPCDVTEFAQVEAVATRAAAAFGRIDTWVNIAAVAVYATFEETSVEEFRRVMDVNLMGYVHGAKAALPHLRRAGGGALIAISSIEGLVSMPFQSAYATSKHAIEGMVDALRRELIAEGAPISVTSIKPVVIDTPFFTNVRSKIGVRPKGPPPVYEPAVVADCVLYAAEHPVRDLYAGGAAKILAVNQMVAPGLLDTLIARFGISSQLTNEPPAREGTLDTPNPRDNRIRGDTPHYTRRFSLYTWLATHPAIGRLTGVAAPALAVVALARRRRAG